jgi:Leucine rich repeat
MSEAYFLTQRIPEQESLIKGIKHSKIKDYEIVAYKKDNNPIVAKNIVGKYAEITKTKSHKLINFLYSTINKTINSYQSRAKKNNLFYTPKVKKIGTEHKFLEKVDNFIYKSKIKRFGFKVDEMKKNSFIIKPKHGFNFNYEHKKIDDETIIKNIQTALTESGFSPLQFDIKLDYSSKTKIIIAPTKKIVKLDNSQDFEIKINKNYVLFTNVRRGANVLEKLLKTNLFMNDEELVQYSKSQESKDDELSSKTVIQSHSRPAVIKNHEEIILDTLINTYTLNTQDYTINNHKVIKLNLTDKKLTEVPKEVFELKNLESLILNQNSLTQLPVELDTLVNLKEIQAYINNLNSIPKLNNLYNLNIIDLSSNKFTKVPREIYELYKSQLSKNDVKLLIVNLSDNLRKGKIPNFVNELKSNNINIDV